MPHSSGFHFDSGTKQGNTVAQGAPQIDESFETERMRERTIGDFRILRQLGRGGMGVVYEAEQLSLDRHVALKVLPFAAVLDDRQLVRFKTEAQAAARLHHPNIVPVHSVGCERGVHFYAMQYINGQSLAAAMQSLRDQAKDDPSGEAAALRGLGWGNLSGSGKSSRSGESSHSPDSSRSKGRSGSQSATSPAAKNTEVVSGKVSYLHPEYCRGITRLMLQAADALEHAHLSGIVHRDIKPGNLLLDANNKLWVTDFGLARIEHDSQLTLTGDVVGTIRYMSPEQALSGRGVDHRTDIYSLGVTFFEALTLRPPFEAKNRNELLTKIGQHDPIRPSRINPKVPAELDAIVFKAMEKEPSARYQSAEEFAKDLRCFLNNLPISARHPTFTSKVHKWSRRHPSVLPSVLLMLLLIATVSFIGAAFISREQLRTKNALEVAKENFSSSEANRFVAEEALRENQLLLYVQGVRLAVDAWQDGDGATAWALMKSNPAYRDREDLQGFEWHHLRQFLPSNNEVLASESVEFMSCDHGRLTAGNDDVDSRVPSYNQSTRDVFAAGDSAGVLRLWDIRRRRSMGVLRGHQGAINSLVFQPDANVLATGGEDGSIRIWDMSQQSESMLLADCHDGQAVVAVCYSADGKTLASSGEDGVIRLWSSDDYRPLREFTGHAGPVRSIAFSADGKLLISGSNDRTLRLWDTETGDAIRTMAGHAGMVLAVCFSPSGQYAFSGSNDGTIRAWKTDSGELAAIINGHHDGIQTIEFLRDQQTLVAGDRSGQVRRWEIEGSRVVDHFEEAYLNLQAVRLAPDGRCWVGLRENGRLIVRDLVLKRIYEVESGGGNEYRGGRAERLAFSPDGTQLYSAGRILYRRSASDSEFRLISKLDVPIGTPGHFSPDGKVLATSRNNVLRFWNPQDCTLINEWQLEIDRAVGVRFSPDGSELAIWDYGETLLIWDVERGVMVKKVQLPSLPTTVEWGPQGKRIAICCDRKAAYLWDRMTEKLSEVNTNGFRCSAVNWLANGKALAMSREGDADFIRWLDGSHEDEIIGPDRSAEAFCTSSRAGQFLSHDDVKGVTVYDLNALSFVSDQSGLLLGHSDRVWSLSAAVNGNELITCSRDGTIRVWPLEISGRWDWLTKQRHPLELIEDFDWSPDGELLLAEYGSLLSVSWPDGEIQRKKNGVGSGGKKVLGFVCEAVTASVDGELFAGGHRDGRVHVWRKGQRKPFRTMQAFADESEVSVVEFSPDGKLLLASSRFANKLKIWSTETWREIESLVASDCDDLAFSPDGRWLAFCDGRDVVLWDVEKGTLARPFPEHSITVHGLAFSKDGRLLVTACEDRKLRVWNPDAGTVLRTIAGHASSIRQVTFSPDDQTLISGDDEGVIKFWNLATGQELLSLPSLGSAIERISFDPDGDALVVLTEEGQMHVFEGASQSNGMETSVLDNPSGEVSEADFTAADFFSPSLPGAVFPGAVFPGAGME
ncbi:MAG: protein kinase [Rubripirellula sp.]|nr:protein kinase [Rubripirellula sp.]